MEKARSLTSLIRRSPDSIEKSVEFFETNNHSGIDTSAVQGVVYLGDRSLGEFAPRPSVAIDALTFVHLDPVRRRKKRGILKRYEDVVFIASAASNPTLTNQDKYSRIPPVGRDANGQNVISDGEMHVVVRLRAGKTTEENILAVGRAAIVELPLQFFPIAKSTLARDVAGQLDLPSL